VRSVKLLLFNPIMYCHIFTVLILVQIPKSLIIAQAFNPLFGTPFDTSQCSLPNDLLAEIRSYQTIANDIFAAATQKNFKGKTYKELEYICDTFGSRLSGSPALEKAVDYIREKFKAHGLVNVREEKVQVPRMKKYVISIIIKYFAALNVA